MLVFESSLFLALAGEDFLIFNNLNSYQSKPRSELKRNTLIILDIIAIVLSILALSPQFKNLDIPLVIDETVHVDDHVAQGNLAAVNPFDWKYMYLGHVPIYRVLAVAWFKVFPDESKYARIFSLALTVFSLFAIYLLFFDLYSWLAGIAAILLLMSSPDFYNYTYLVLADIIVCGMFIMAFYSAIKGNDKITALAFFILVMTRESGLAFAVSYFTAYLLLNGITKENVKKMLKILGLGLLSIGTFFLINKIKYDVFSRHPNASKTYVHAHMDSSYRFFSLTIEKFETLIKVLKSTSSNSILLYVLSLIILITMIRRRNQNKKTKLLVLLCFFTAIQFFVFFSLYQDYVTKDGVIITTMLVILSMICLLEYFPKKWIMLLLVITIPNFFINDRFSRPALETSHAKFYERVAMGIDENFSGKTVCLPRDLRPATKKIHGMFKYPLQFKHSCQNDTEVASLFSGQAPENAKIMMKMIKDRGYRLIFKETKSEWYAEFYSN